MANRWAVANGNWSNTATWNGGTLPTSADVVYTNNFNVNVDTDFTVNGLSSTSNTGITAGGTFTFNTANVTATISGNITINTTSLSFILITATTGTVTINASNAIINAAAVASSIFFNYSGNCNFTLSCIRLIAGNNNLNYMVRKTSTGTFTLNGNMQIGGTSSGITAITNGCMVLYSDTASTNIINGSILAGGANNGNNVGIYQTAGTLNITGDINGGTFGNSYGLYLINTITTVIGSILGNVGNSINISGAITLAITGNITGGAGISILSSANIVNITGDIISGGNNAIATTAGTLNITGKITGGTSNGAAGVSISATTLNHIGICQASAFASAIICNTPTTATIVCTGPFLRNGYTVAVASQTLRINSAYNPYFEFRKSDGTNVTYVDQSTSNFPAIGDVRNGTTYASGVYTGTLKVPTAAQVLAGIPVDATTGTLLMTPAQFWNYLVSSGFLSGSMGERLQNASTVATTGAQIASYNI